MSKKLIAQSRAEFDLMRHYLYLMERNPRRAEQFWRLLRILHRSQNLDSELRGQ